MATKVIFRKFRDGDVIALFPEIPADILGHNCQSYMHVGQHGAADPHLSGRTAPATPEEYADLMNELTRIGYDGLVVVRRMTRAMDERRRAAVAAHV